MGIPISSPEQVRTQREVTEADRDARIEHRRRVSPPTDYTEADRLAEVVRQAFAEQYRLGEICFSLQRCRERATDYGYGDVVLLIQPKIDEYQDRLKVARDAYEAADFECRAFNVREWRNAD
jgi:hypothetical protein